MGCIGHDEFGRILEKKVIEAGVNPRYKFHESEPTGTCAVCLTGTNRLVTFLHSVKVGFHYPSSTLTLANRNVRRLQPVGNRSAFCQSHTATANNPDADLLL